MLGEGWLRRLWPAAGFLFAFIAAVTLLKSAANAVVVARFRAEALPWLYVGSAALAALVTAKNGDRLLFRRRQSECRPRKSSLSPFFLSLVGAGVVALIGWGLREGISTTALALYVFVEAFTTYTAIVFWSRMSDAFDARESRRAFTVVAGIGMSGSIAGGFLTEWLAPRAGTVSLVVSGAAMLTLAAAFFRFHAPSAQHAAPAPPRHGERAQIGAFLRSHSYPFSLGALILTLSVITPFADFVFRERAARTLGEDELAALFGNLQQWMGLFCVVFQLLIAERLLAKVGILRYVAIVPLLLLPFAAATLWTEDLRAAYLLKLVENATALSIFPVAVQLLYAPIPDEVRDRVRALVDGMAKKGGLALGGVALIVAGPLAVGPAPAAALVVLCIAALIALVRLRPAYVTVLQQSIGDAPVVQLPLDESSEQVLVAALRSPEPDHVVRALALLEHAGADLRPHLSYLVAHRSERVVEHAVRLAVTADAREAAPELERMLEAPSRPPPVEVVWALARLAPDRAARALPPLVNHSDAALRIAAVGALVQLKVPGIDAQAMLRALAKKGAAAPIDERREVARLLGRLGDGDLAGNLARYLNDSDASVRAAAIHAVGEGQFLSLVPELVSLLAVRGVRRQARDALSRFGDPVVPALEQALNDRAFLRDVRYQLPRVLRRIGTQAAFDVLLFSNVRDDAYLHWRIALALSKLKEEREDLSADALRVRDAIDRRRDIHRRLVDPFRDLRAGLGDGSLLTRAVGDRLDQAFEISFWLLGLLYPAKSMRRVHQHLVGDDPRRRAYALELLENLLSEDDRELVMEQTHAHHRELPPGAAGRMQIHVALLCHSDDYVLRACARQVARSMGIWTRPRKEDEMSEATVQRMFALEGVEIFAQTDVDDVAAIAQMAREHRFAAGEKIYDEGDPGDALYVIVSGRVDAYRRGEKVLSLESKQAFGDVSLLDGSPRPTQMVAAEDTTVLVIDRRDFMDLVSDRPEILQGIFRVVSRQLRQMVDLAASRATAGAE